MLGLSIGQPGRPISPFPADTPFALSFIDKRYLVAGEYVPAEGAFTVTRNSAKLAQDGAGYWHSFGADVAAVTNRGLLLEPSATNVLRNNAMEGAVAGNPGTLPTNWGRFAGGGPTLSVAGIGMEAGLPYIDIRLSGMSGSSSGAAIHFEQTNTAAATQGQNWTGSVFVRLVGGAVSNLSAMRLNLQEANSSGSGTNTHYGSDIREQISEQGSRVWESRVLVGATTSFVRGSIELIYAGGAVLDMTLRLSGPQLEEGSAATSPILTAGAPGSRAADILTLLLPEGVQDLAVLYGDGSTGQLTEQMPGISLPASEFRPVAVAEISPSVDV